MCKEETGVQYKNAVEYLLSIPKFTKKNSLDHTKELLGTLGNPQDQMKIIHVAGSNGKGSVCMFLDHILRAAGKKTGLFTSPHLEDIRERFVIDGAMCSKEEFLEAYREVSLAVDIMKKKNFPHPTFFEFIFAMGVVLFSRAGVEYAVLETGLGGRLDATNSISRPLVTVITSISLEHTEILGDTIEKIAGEKAGILKPGVPVVCDGTSEEGAAVIEQKARELGCPCCVIRPDMCKIRESKNKFIDFSIFTEYDNGTSWNIPFVSAYQAMNGALAVTAVRMLTRGDGKWDAAIRTGLQNARWPGRMEEIRPEIYLDGAHNTAGIREFIRTAAFLCREDSKKPLLLFSMVKEKDYHETIRLLTKAQLWESVTVTLIPGQRGLSETELLKTFQEDGREDTSCFHDYREAFQSVYRKKSPGQKLFCTGSLYFIGALRNYIKTIKQEEQK